MIDVELKSVKPMLVIHTETLEGYSDTWYFDLKNITHFRIGYDENSAKERSYFVDLPTAEGLRRFREDNCKFAIQKPGGIYCLPNLEELRMVLVHNIR